MNPCGNLSKSWKPTKAGWLLAATSRTQAGIELMVLLSLLLLVLWTDSKYVLDKGPRRALHAVAAVGILAVAGRGSYSRASFGLAPRSWTDGVIELLAATGLAAGAIAGLALATASLWPALTAPLANAPEMGRWLLRNVPVQGVQQVLLQVLLVPRLELVLGRRDGVVSLAAATLFGLLHLPNGLLTPLTFVAAWYWCDWYRRYRNLPALWLSHCLIAAVVLTCWNGPLLYNLRVGIGYVLRSS